MIRTRSTARPALFAVSAFATALLLGSTSVHAQTGSPGLPPGGTLGEEDGKPEGVAEAAPKDTAALPTLPTLPPYPGEQRKEFELFELDGYFRFRTDWLKNFHLGFHDLGNGTPFREPLSCLESASAMNKGDCTDSINSANMRFRLEPIINLSEQVKVMFQVDILDNLVLGSTPDGTLLDGTSAPANVPAPVFAGGQVPPEAGRNNISDSIRVKRAWAEIRLPNIGVLRFGRMPSQWGLGVLANSGGYDPYKGTTCLDCDFGDSADRLLFGTMIPGTGLRAAIARDWASQGPSSAQTAVWQNRFDGQSWDLDDTDDVSQWIFVIGKLASGPAEWKDLVDTGELALNYGLYVVRRTQDWDESSFVLGTNNAQDNLVKRGASLWIPDAYFRLGWHKLSVEAEAVAIFGTVDNLSDISAGVIDQDVQQFGGVVRAEYLLFDDSFNVGLEVGFATGDQYDGSPQGNTNVRDVISVPDNLSDKTLSAFKFDFDYQVDLIFFREILGTVTNATYIRPRAAYNLTERFKFTGQSVISFANKPVATPGNSSFYGVELDGDLAYLNEREGFFAGASLGVFFPGAAMSHPEMIFPTDEVGDASTAWTIQTRLGVTF